MNTTAQDTWTRPYPYTENQAKLIKTICEERGVTAEQVLAVFPKRPTTANEASRIIVWLKAQPVASAPTQPSVPQLPDRFDKSGKALPLYYAVDMDDTVKFYRVTKGRKPGFYFIDAQGSDEFYPIRNTKAITEIVKAIAAQGPEAAQKRYGQEIGNCGRCGRTLTDAQSRAYGIGPVCIDK